MLEGGDDQVQVLQLVKKTEGYALGASPRVKGRLKQKVEFWEKVIKATVPVINMIKQGYILPFVSVPADKQFSNQRSVVEHVDPLFFCFKIVHFPFQIFTNSVSPPEF